MAGNRNLVGFFPAATWSCRRCPSEPSLAEIGATRLTQGLLLLVPSSCPPPSRQIPICVNEEHETRGHRWSWSIRQIDSREALRRYYGVASNGPLTTRRQSSRRP